MQSPPVTLLHNPRCSKSRGVLAMLEARGLYTEIRLYREAPLSVDELSALVAKLEQPSADLIRTNDAKKLGLVANPASMSDEDICIWLAKHPESMQRPVVISGRRAVIGRPPEKILDLLDNTET